MGVEANKALVAELFARFSANDVAGALDTLADDVNWWIAGKPEAQPAAGPHDKAWIARLFARMVGQLDGPMPMTVKGLVAEGDSVAVEVIGHGRLRDGRRYENEYHFAITVRDGKISAVREHLDTQHVVATWFAPPAPAGVEELVAYCTQEHLVRDLQIVQVYEELENLAYWLRGFAPHNVLEIGTLGMTFFLLSRLSTGKKASVDLRDVRPKIRGFMQGHDWQFFQGDSQTEAMRDAVASFCPRFDLIFIDGDHSFEGVERDFELYRELLSERGAILFHDVDPQHVFKDGYGGGVYRFWEELDCGVKTMLCCTRSSGKLSFQGQKERFGGIGIWKPA